VGLDGAPFTNTLNISSSLVNNKVGVGLMFISDQFGVNSNTEIISMYSYKLALTEDLNLSFGIQVGQMSYRHDFSKLTQNQAQSDPDLAFADDFTKVNFGTGLFLTGDNFFIGASVPRIKNIDVANNAGDDITRYYKHIYISGGYIFNKGSMLAFKPSFLLKTVNGQTSVDLNAHIFINETLWVGATSRNFDTMGISSQINIGDQLRVGYSFELPMNSLGTLAYGTTHELMVSYDFELLGAHFLEKRYY